MKPLVTTKPTITIGAERSIVTNVSIAQQTNHQFLHTLGNDIFIYVFGDRIGQISLSGFSFMNSTEADCEGSSGAAGVKDKHGLDLILGWYKRNKLSSRREAVDVVLGSTAFKAFVVGISTQVQDPKTFLVGYNMTMALIPEKDDEEAVGSSVVPAGQAIGEGSSATVPTS
jgi:hypothetical protein